MQSLLRRVLFYPAGGLSDSRRYGWCVISFLATRTAGFSESKIMHIDNDGHAIRAMSAGLDAVYSALESGRLAECEDALDREENRDKEPEE